MSLVIPPPSQKSAHHWPYPPGGVSPDAGSSPQETRPFRAELPQDWSCLTEETGVSVDVKMTGEDKK